MCHKLLSIYNCRHTEESVRSCSKRDSTIIKQRCLSDLRLINPDQPIKIPGICFQCSREPFRFMDLPRELRDMIYASCVSDCEAPRAYHWPREESSTRVVIRGKPWMGLLLSNHQLFREYRARIVKGVEVLLVDHFRQGMALDAPKLHPNLSKAPIHFRLLLLAPCERCEKGMIHAHCYVKDEFNCQQRWVQTFSEDLGNPKSLRVRFDVWWPPKFGDGEIQWPDTPHMAFRMEESAQNFVQVEKLTELEICRIRGTAELKEGTNGLQMEQKNQDLVARWTASGKW
ncbi:Hypothetical predicted protein [Lecanosticta acicola]|uniref:Uncharacterized protein n=1 Tax=Lecanosticta acicola TaxID=111012 RepID=A0AAI8Z2Q9_9PEZI|nr:Hypothetical predicted protein [Lecanosticta acicola]